MVCLDKCKELSVSCPNESCRMWISHEEEYNCAYETVAVNGSLTLREAALRLGLSFVRVKQIQDSAMEKIKKSFPA